MRNFTLKVLLDEFLLLGENLADFAELSEAEKEIVRAEKKQPLQRVTVFSLTVWKKKTASS